MLPYKIENIENHEYFSNSFELVQILIYFITLCHELPCIEYTHIDFFFFLAGWGRGRGHFRGPRGGCHRGSGGSVPPFWMPPANNHFDLMNIGQAVRAALDPFGVDVDVSIETPAKKPRSERDTEMDQAQKEKVDKASEAKENMTTKAAER